jgi:hypothetical protein
LNCLKPGTVWARSRVLLGLALLVTVAAVALAGLGRGAGKTPVGGSSEATSALSFAPARWSAGGGFSLRSAYGQLPLAFEVNQGQADSPVKFLARGGGYGLFLTANEAALTLQHPAASGPQSASRTSIIRMALDGANENAVVVGTDELPGKSNYFIGNDPSKWHRNVPQFAGVRYQNVYPGVDLVYYGNQGRLEYDFEVAPGADPNQVDLRFGATEKLKLDAQGNLAIVSGGAEIRFEAPRAYQKIGQERRLVAGRFILGGENRVKFELGAYDRSRTLVIDPVLAYSTYLGGKGNEACSAILPSGTPTSGCPAIAVDPSGNIYIAGSTTSINLPLTPPPVPPATGPLPFQACLDHPDTTSCPNDLTTSDAFVAKINPSASPASAQLVFSTYLGGSGSETTAGVAVDSGFNVIVAGNTNSPDFPTDGALNAFQATPEVPGSHVFVSKLDPTGATLIYSTYLSGNGTDTATGLAVDIKGKAYVTGTTTSTDTPSAAPPTAFPATIGAFQTMSRAATCNVNVQLCPQFFVSKIDPALTGFSSLVYSTYFGGGTTAGNAPIVANGGGIAVDVNSVVYFTGGTNFLNTGGGTGTDFPILNAYQLCLDTPKNPTGSCPTTGPTIALTDIFLAKLDPSKSSGAQLLYSTYLGGTSSDVGYGVAVDSGTNAYLTGSTTSTDFNFTPATGVTVFQGTNAGGTDAFVAKIGPPCATTTTTCPQGTVPLLYFTYLGGTGTDVGLGIAVDSIQGAQVTGYTTSTIFPHLNNPIQTTLAGPQDAFITRIDTTATTATAPGHFSTYLGGADKDAGTSIALDVRNFTYVGGETFSNNFPPAPAPFQGALDGTSDAFIAKLSPFVNLKVSETASPNPVGVGNQVSFIYTIVNNGDLTTGITFADTFSSTGVNFVSASSSPGSCTAALVGSVTCSVGTLNGGASATVTVILIPTVGGSLSDGGQVTVFGSPRIFTPPVPAVATVSDFLISVPTPSVTVPAGTPASYSVLVSPGGGPFPDTVTLSVSGTFPAGVTQSFPNGGSVDLSSGAQSRLLVLNTQMRVTTPASLWRRGGVIYAALIPLSGMALLGVGLGSLGTGRRGSRRRLLMQALLGAFLTLVLFQAGCGTTASTPTTTGTPVGNYLFTVTGTSGPVSHTQQIFLNVK